MQRFYRLVIFGVVAWAATGPICAQGDGGAVVFVGSVVNDACNSAWPPLATRGGVGSCGVRGLPQAFYLEQTSIAAGHTGVAMLDYFADRPDGARKYVVTRQYL